MPTYFFFLAMSQFQRCKPRTSKGHLIFNSQDYENIKIYLNFFRDSGTGLRLNGGLFVPVFDATAKLPSGILNGNGNQYGDFDECLSIDGPVRGKYCLASLEMTLRGDAHMDQLDFMVHSGHYIRSNVTDVSLVLNLFTFIFFFIKRLCE